MKASNKKKMGYFISFEGIDSSGKSLQSRFLNKAINEKKYNESFFNDFNINDHALSKEKEIELNEKLNKILKYFNGSIWTREPGGDEIAEEIREILLTPKYKENMAPQTEALLFASARSSHVNNVILPALKKHKMVICDRYIDSSLAYQGIMRKLGFDIVKTINEFGTHYLYPNLTFLFEISEDIYRKRNENKILDRIELGLKFKLVISAFRKTKKIFHKRFITINGNESIIDTHEKILDYLIIFFENKSLFDDEKK